jgi:hypothetical protein
LKPVTIRTVTTAAHPSRLWSWAKDADDVEVRRAHAQNVVGAEIARIRYFTLDYFRWEVAPEFHGPRTIEDQKEWDKPCWSYPGFDTLDFGLEIESTAGEIYSVTWDPPGNHEGIGISKALMVPSGLAQDAPAAIWDVTERSRWKAFVGRSIDSITMNYLPWSTQGEFWCTRITIEISDTKIQLLLADGKGEDDPAIYPSADNVAVIFPPTEVPDWEVHRMRWSQ